MTLSKLDTYFKENLRVIRVVRCISRNYCYKDKIGKYYLVQVGLYRYNIIAEIQYTKEHGGEFEVVGFNSGYYLLNKSDCNVILKK